MDDFHANAGLRDPSDDDGYDFKSHNHCRQNGLATRYLHENRPSLSPPFPSKQRNDEFETRNSLQVFSF